MKCEKSYALKKNKKKIRNFIIPIILIFSLFFIIEIVANTIIQNNPSNYYTADNITINNTGVYYNISSGNTKLTKTANFVVCRGNDILDDIIKMFTCDVVCKSTDNDCMNELRSVMSNDSYVLISPGVYPIISYMNESLYWNYNGYRNVYIQGYGAILNATQNGDFKNTLVIKNSSNIKIEGLTFIGNKTCAPGCTYSCNCHGIFIEDSDKIYLENIEVKDFLGFQVFINSILSTNDVYIYNSKFKGLGSNDVIGGGSNNINSFIRNIYIYDNLVNQTNEIGTYDTGIDLVGVNDTIINNNIVYGGIAYGYEQKGTYNSYISNNIIHSLNTIVGGIDVTNETSSDIFIINNYIDGGYINVKANNSVISNNRIINKYTTNPFTITFIGNNGAITNNYISGGSRGVYTKGNYTIISNNLIRNISSYFGSNPLIITLEKESNHQQVSDNILIIENGVYVQNSIYIAENSSWNNVNDNKVINYGEYPSTNLTNFVTLKVSSHNNSVYNNQFIGNYTGSYMSLGSYNHYLSDYTYPISITSLSCSKFNVFNERIIHNSTTSCLCTGGTWKCWNMA